MDNITVREFKAKLSHYLRLMREGVIVTVNGEDFGKILKTDEKRSHAVVTENEMAYSRPSSVVTPVVTVDSEGSFDKCEKCGVRNADWGFEEDGLERLTCDDCVRKVWKGKMYSFVTKKYRKLNQTML